MNVTRDVLARLLAATTLLGLFVFAPASANASVPDCGTFTVGDHIGRQHQDDSDLKVAAIHAPIELRKDVQLCPNAIAKDAFSSNYIDLEDNYSGSPDYKQIRQIGWDADPGAAPGNAPYCKFFAIGIGAPHDYACTFSDTTVTYFQIEYNLPINVIQVEDCGQTDYSICTAMATDDAPDEFVASALTETNYPCQIYENGDDLVPVEIGTGDHAVHMKDNYSDSWGLYPMGINMATSCPDDYMKHWSTTNYDLTTWDNRNSS